MEHALLEEAHEKYKEDFEISKALIKEEPSNAEYQFGMSVSLIKMGRLHALEENYSLAQETWAQAKVILQELLDKPFRDYQWAEVMSIVEKNIQMLPINFKSKT